jgi:hypothetical protein
MHVSHISCLVLPTTPDGFSFQKPTAKALMASRCWLTFSKCIITPKVDDLLRSRSHRHRVDALPRAQDEIPDDSLFGVVRTTSRTLHYMVRELMLLLRLGVLQPGTHLCCRNTDFVLSWSLARSAFLCDVVLPN